MRNGKCAKILTLCVVASIIGAASYIMKSYADPLYPRAILRILLEWGTCLFIAGLNLIPPLILRFVLIGAPLRGASAVLASLINYASAMLVMVSYNTFVLLTGGAAPADSYFLILICIYTFLDIFFAILILWAGGEILTVQDVSGASDGIIPADKQTQCMMKLGTFIGYANENIREDRGETDVIWHWVYEYLKDKDTIERALGRGMQLDEIVLNAVGAIANRLLTNGRFSGDGSPSPEEKYLLAVWKLAAAELVRLSFNTAEEMDRGFSALTDLVSRSREMAAK
ncbi:hypothetical protein FACS1894216_19610 [Synergistales bacterium]|nr:hypothetical protein FACS1894216_19610 [Synergistales bacterium]